MGLADNLNAGMSVIENFNRNKMLHDQARINPQMLQAQLALQQANAGLAGVKYKYDEPLTQEELKKAQIMNQYLPLTQQADAAYKMAMSRYMGSNAQIERGMSPEGKLLFEQQLMNKGDGINMFTQPPVGLANSYPVLPGGQAPNAMKTGVTPQIVNDIQRQGIVEAPDGTLKTRDQINNIYDAALQKKTSDVQTRTKAKYAINIDKTMARIDPNVMANYSGPAGEIRLKADYAASLAGNSSPNFLKFQKIIGEDIPILTEQVRQFFSTSIQPSVKEGLEQLANPTNWKTQPEVMIAKYNEFKTLLQNETSTYLDNLNAPIRPEKVEADRKTAQEKLNAADSGRVRVINKDGQVGTIPASQLDAALKAGFKRG